MTSAAWAWPRATVWSKNGFWSNCACTACPPKAAPMTRRAATSTAARTGPAHLVSLVVIRNHSDLYRVRSTTDRNGVDDAQAIDVDDRHGVGQTVGRVHPLAVRRDRNAPRPAAHALLD